jgi:lysophospholipase L1-like esterase
MNLQRISAVLRRFGLALLLFVVIGELVVRLVEQFVGGTGSLYDFVVPVGKRYVMRPSSSVLVPERYGDVFYRFNRTGNRDTDPTPDSSGRRIVLLGDSVSFGIGVDQESIFSSLLENRLRRERRKPWEVLNLAIWAYHTGHQLETLETEGLRARPRVVIVQFYMNDFAVRQESGSPPPPPNLGQRLTALKNRALYSSAFVRRINQLTLGLSYALLHDLRRRHFPETLNATEARADLEYLRATPDDRQVAAFQILRRIRDVAGANGAATLVLISPNELQLFTRGYDLINERILAFCRKNWIDVVDPLADLRSAPDRWKLFLDGVHLTPEGHRRYADLLYRELVERGLVLAPPQPPT